MWAVSARGPGVLWDQGEGSCSSLSSLEAQSWVVEELQLLCTAAFTLAGQTHIAVSGGWRAPVKIVIMFMFTD